MRMRSRIVALAATVLVAVALTTGVALASAAVSRFQATTSFAQLSAGTLTPIVRGGVPAGIHITGEQFGGAIDSCAGGPICAGLQGAQVSVTQNATILFAGPPDLTTGAIDFVGTTRGIFSIAQGAGNTLEGKYRGTLSGTLTPFFGGAFFLSGNQKSAWQLTDSEGAFEDIEKGAGSFSVALGGVFPGFETAIATFSGTVTLDD